MQTLFWNKNSSGQKQLLRCEVADLIHNAASKLDNPDKWRALKPTFLKANQGTIW